VLVVAAISSVVGLSLLERTVSPEVTSQPTAAPVLQPSSDVRAQDLTPVPCPMTELDRGILATPLREVDLSSIDPGIQAPTPENLERFALLSTGDSTCFVSRSFP
jgi:hypothetical protein